MQNPTGDVWVKVSRETGRGLTCGPPSKIGYHPTTQAQNIWEHETRKAKLCLCVDDFGIKYYNSSDTEHLLSALKQAYTVTVNRTGVNFCELDIEWHYSKGYVEISMPEYVQKALLGLKHIPPSKP